MPQLLTDLIACPPKESINTGVEPCPTAYLVARYGLPCDPLPSEPKGVEAITNAFWHQRMVTESVGPFRVTGHNLAVIHLRETLVAVHDRKPVLYNALGSAGMLAVRMVRIRGRSLAGHPSNHSLGLAIDFTLSGKLDVQGDRKVMRGLVDLYAIFKTFGWFWGAEFGTEDSMHFEIGSAVVRGWIKAGLF